MRIEGNMIYADEGNILRRIEDQRIFGESYSLGYTYYMGDEKLPEPKLELPEHFEEINKEEYERQVHEENLKKYPSVVEELIRERYSVSDELAIQRQRDTKVDEFAEYNNYCENCKRIAKSVLNLETNDNII